MIEELKAQTGALFLLDFLRAKKHHLRPSWRSRAYVDSIVWAFGHISQGMYTGTSSRKTYGNLAAIQIGYLIEHGALTWDANGDRRERHRQGRVHDPRRQARRRVVDEMMKTVAGIKARGDKAARRGAARRATSTGTRVPQKLISERFLRFPKASFVYSISP